MHALSLLNSWFQRNHLIGHRSRLSALLRVVAALLDGGKLALTHLGRARAGSAFVKHHIKSVDRLLGNPHLNRERFGVYRAMAHSLLARTTRPLLIVDWADCELERQLLIIKAAVPVRGRAITIYEEVHPLRRYNSRRTHRAFLERLQQVLPEHVCPIIVTDAGFRGPWFRDVEALGWDWIGRIRNRIKFFNPSTKRWAYTDSLYCEASPKSSYIGRRTLSKRHRYQCQLYLVRAYRRGPGRPKKRKRYGTNYALYQRLHRAPWLLATSLPHHRGSAARIVRAYAQRMEIEETFRDLKNHRWGFALRYARTKRPERLQILLLIAALATWVLWLIGLVGQAKRWARHFQANTERKRSVLSLVFLGHELWFSTLFKITRSDINVAFSKLPQLINERCEFA